MVRNLFALCCMFAVVFADPIPKLPSSTDDLDSPSYDSVDNTNQELSRVLPSAPAYLVLDIISALVGYKFSTALSLGVFVIEWLVSNFVIIFAGAAALLGLCKVTGKCSLNYEEYVPVAHLRSIVNPEYLETAENFLVSAVEKYAEKKAKEIRNRSFAY